MEFIRDQRSGAKKIQLDSLSKEELKRLVWVFPEARLAYLELLLKGQVSLTK